MLRQVVEVAKAFSSMLGCRVHFLVRTCSDLGRVPKRNLFRAGLYGSDIFCETPEVTRVTDSKQGQTLD